MSDSSQDAGFLHAFLLDGHGGGRHLTWQEAQDWQPSDGKIWLHMDYSTPLTQDWLRHHSELDHLISDALLSEESRPRTLGIEDGLLMALRGVNKNPGADPEDMVSIRIWVDEHRIITTLKRNLLSVNTLIQRLEKNKGPQDTADLLINLTDQLIRMMSDTVDDFEDQIAELETQTLTSESPSLKSELAALRRQTIAIKRYLAPKREAMNRLLVEKVSWLTPDHRMQLREVNDRLIRHIEDIDAVRERTAVAHEEVLSRISEQLNERMYVLSIIAAIFLPLGFFTGLLGVNLNGIPGSESPYAFIVFTAALILVVAVQFWLFKRRKWL